MRIQQLCQFIGRNIADDGDQHVLFGEVTSRIIGKVLLIQMADAVTVTQYRLAVRMIAESQLLPAPRQKITRLFLLLSEDGDRLAAYAFDGIIIKTWGGECQSEIGKCFLLILA